MNKLANLTAVIIILSVFLINSVIAEGDDKASKKPKSHYIAELSKIPDEVLESVNKGAEYILSKQSKEGSWSSYLDFGNSSILSTAICCYALIKDHSNSTEIERGIDYIRESIGYSENGSSINLRESTGLIECALGIIVFEAYYGKRGGHPKNGDKDLLLRPLDEWLAGHFKRYAPQKDKKLFSMLVSNIVGSLENVGNLSKVSRNDKIPGDVSLMLCVQALGSAKRVGCEIPDEVWFNCIEYVLSSQEKTGPETSYYSPPVTRENASFIKLIEKDLYALLRNEETEYFNKPLKKPDDKKDEPVLEFETIYAKGWVDKKLDNDNNDVISTCCAINILLTAKLSIENCTEYYKKYSSDVDKALKYGLAWLYHNHERITEIDSVENCWMFYNIELLESSGASVRLCSGKNGDVSLYDKILKKIMGLQDESGKWKINKSADNGIIETALTISFLLKSPSILLLFRGVNEFPERQ